MSEAHVPPQPTDEQMQRLAAMLAPLTRVTQPLMLGLENIPDRPALFVGNHTRFGVLDMPFMVSGLWGQRQIMVRGLGDHAHYNVPVWRDLLTSAGMVRGTRENVRTLMGEGQHVLVYPGGAGEVFKGRKDGYTLIWKERLGFAKMAIEFGYPIVPFAAVGAEEMFDVILDRDTLPAPLRDLLERAVKMKLPPIPRGIGLTPIPRPERLYFWFGEPIATSDFTNDSDAGPSEVKRQAKAAVEHGIAHLLETRGTDPHRKLIKRIISPDKSRVSSGTTPSQTGAREP